MDCHKTAHHKDAKRDKQRRMITLKFHKSCRGLHFGGPSSGNFSRAGVTRITAVPRQVVWKRLLLSCRRGRRANKQAGAQAVGSVGVVRNNVTTACSSLLVD